MENNYNIAEIFADLELELVKSLKRNITRHRKEEIKEGFEWPQWQAEKLKELKRFQSENRDVVKKYSNQIDKSASFQMQEQFKEGKKRTDEEIENALEQGYKLNKEPGLQSFFQVNDRKVKKLINVTTKDLHKAEYAALRMMDDVYRQTVYKAQLRIWPWSYKFRPSHRYGY